MGTLTAGIKEIFSSAKTTGTNVMLCTNDGTPDGHMTKANLANALGESIPISSLDDWNNLTTGGRFFVKVLGAAHAPNPSNWFHVIVLSAGGYKKQIAFIDNSDIIYVRGFFNSSWTQWRQVF